MTPETAVEAVERDVKELEVPRGIQLDVVWTITAATHSLRALVAVWGPAERTCPGCAPGSCMTAASGSPGATTHPGMPTAVTSWKSGSRACSRARVRDGPDSARGPPRRDVGGGLDPPCRHPPGDRRRGHGGADPSPA